MRVVLWDFGVVEKIVCDWLEASYARAKFRPSVIDRTINVAHALSILLPLGTD